MTETPEHVDFETVQSGGIPWSLDGLVEAIEHWGDLFATPHDDWDRKKRGLRLENDDGSLTALAAESGGSKRSDPELGQRFVPRLQLESQRSSISSTGCR